MPRIDAPTVAEHRARQRHALIVAARALLAETGDLPSMATVGRRAGLARSSVYEYFTSSDDLMNAVIADVFPDWSRQVHERVAAAPSPGERVWAYVEANVDLFASSELAVAHALAKVVEPDVLRGPMQEFHAQLQVPLQLALAELGEPEPLAAAEMVDALIVHACRPADSHGETPRQVQDRGTALSLLRRMLAGYLGLPTGGAPGDGDRRAHRPEPTG